MSIENAVIEQQAQQLGRGLGDEAVVVGSGAIALAFDAAGVPFRQPHDADLAVSEGGYTYLRSQPGWEEHVAADGTHVLRNGACEVGTGWADTTYQALHGRSWQTASGTRVASLADVRAYKRARGSAQDEADISYMRQRLQDPEGAPMPVRVLAHEVETARAVLPEHLRDDEEAQAAIHLAASGLYIVGTLYGHPEIGRVGQVVGALEKPDYGVPATYHNGFGLPRDMRLLQAHFTLSGAPDQDRLDGLAADPYADGIYGNGRLSDNPEGHDELLSARLIAGHARALGYSEARIARLQAAILGTTFDEQTGAQRGKHHPDAVVRAVTGIDLQGLSEADSVEATLDLAVEDGYSARFSPVRTIGKVMLERGVRIDTTQAGLEAIDTFAHAKPADAPDGPTVLQAFAARLAGNAGFHERHEYPDGWMLDNPAMRRDHATFLTWLSQKLADPHDPTGAVEARRLARQHTQAMRERYGRA